jgi:hypothetical protein
LDNIGLLALVPLLSLLAGGIAGLIVARLFGLRLLLWLLGALGAVSLVIIIWLAGVGEGEETAAFLPFAGLVGAVFPALFGAIMGGLAGRAWAARSK